MSQVNELNVLMKDFEVMWKLLEKLFKVAHSSLIEQKEYNLMKKKVKALRDIMGDGKERMNAFVLKWDGRQSAIAREVVRRANLKPDLKFLPVESNGYTIIYTNKDGQEMINKLYEQVLRDFGRAHAEKRPSDLARDILEDVERDGGTNELLTISVPVNQYEFIVNKGVALGNDFTMAPIFRDDGMVDISVRKSDMFAFEAGEKWISKNDLFTELIRSAVAVNQGGVLKKEIEYDRKMKDNLLKFEGPGKMYVTSAINGSEYIDVSKEGFQKYSIVTEGYNIRRIKSGEFIDRDRGEDEYKKLLYKELSKMDKPIALNNDIYKAHERELSKYIGTGIELDFEYSAQKLMQRAIKKVLPKNLGIEIPESVSIYAEMMKYNAMRDVTVAAFKVLNTKKLAKHLEGASKEALKDGFYQGGIFESINKDLYQKYREALNSTLAYQDIDLDRAKNDREYSKECHELAFVEAKEKDPELFEKVEELEKDYFKALDTKTIKDIEVASKEALKDGFYLGGILGEIDPDLHKQYIDALDATFAHQDMDFEKAMNDPEYLKECHELALAEAKENEPELFQKIEKTEKDYIDTYVSYCDTITEAIDFEANPEIEKELKKCIETAREAKPDHALDVVLTSCVTGRVVENVRPMELDTKALGLKDISDSMAEELAGSLEKSLSKDFDLKEFTKEDFAAMMNKAGEYIKEASEISEARGFNREVYGNDLGRLYQSYRTICGDKVAVTKAWQEISANVAEVAKDVSEGVSITPITESSIKEYKAMESEIPEYKLLDARNEAFNDTRNLSAQKDDISFGQSEGDKPRTTGKDRDKSRDKKKNAEKEHER